ncbi:MAG: multidrug transporter [Candidatus Altiarchaeota archaeon]
MKTKPLAIAIVFFSTLFTAAGQILFKFSSRSLFLSPFFLNIEFIIGVSFYIFGAILLIIALKYGELSILYPIYSLSYVWVSLASPYFFPSDEMNAIKWFGILLIILGVSFIAKGSQNG